MAQLVLTGTLVMERAMLDWRRERATCVGLFRSADGGSVEVQYEAVLDQDALDLLARLFLRAGLPTLRAAAPAGPVMAVPSGEIPDVPKLDRRTRAWKLHQREAAAAGNGNGADSGGH